MPFRGRHLFRIVVILLLAGAAILLILMATPWPAEWLRREIVRRAGAFAGGRLEIASLEIQFFPPRAVARGIVYERDDPSGGELRLACGEADLSVPYRIYRGKLDRIDSVRLSHPELFWKRSGATLAGARPMEGMKEKGAPPPVIGSLILEEGSVRILDPGNGWEARLDGVNLRAAGKGAAHLEGSLEGSRVRFRKGEREVTGLLNAGLKVEGRRVAAPTFRLDTGAGEFGAAGALDLDLSGPSPRLHVTGDASLPERETPRDLLGDLSGRLHLDLRGEGREDGFHVSAKVSAPEVSYRGLKAESMTLEAAYRPGEVSVQNFQAKALGGTMTGEGSLRWGEGGFSRSRLETKVSLADGSVGEIVRFLRLPPLPLTGRVRHSGEYTLEGFDPATLEARGEIALAGRLEAGVGERVTGAGRFRIASSTLEVEEASLMGGGGSASFRGSIGLAGNKEVDGALRIAGARLALIRPLLEGLPESARRPLLEIVRDSAGASLEFDGRLTRDSAGVTVAGKADAQPLALRGSRLGDLHARFSASASRVDVEEASLSGGETTLEFTGWLSPESAVPLPGDSFSVKGQASGIDAAWLMDWSAIRLPIEGKAAGDFALSGRPEKLQGRVDWKMEKPVVATLPLDGAEGKIALDPAGLRIEEMRLFREGGKLEAAGNVGFGQSPILVYLNGDGIDLEWLYVSGLIPRRAAGRIKMQGQLTGTLDRPFLEADLETPGITVDTIDLGAISARVSADRAGAEFQVCPEEKGIALSGKVGFEDLLPFQIELVLESFEVGASAFGGDLAGVDAGAVLTGSVHASGALKDLSKQEATGTLERIALRFGQEQLESQGPATFRWKRPRLEVTPFHLKGIGTDVRLSGTAEPEGGSYQFTADGEVALATLAPFWPGVAAGGTGAFSFSLEGSAAGSRLEGWFSVLGGRLQGGGLPFPISSLQGRLVLDPPGGFHLEGVSLTGGGGRMTLDGKGALGGFRVTGLDLALTGSDVLIFAPKGFRGRYDLDLHLTQDASRKILGGKIELIRGVYDRDFQLDRNLLSLGREAAPSEAEEESSQEPGFFSTTGLDLDLEANRGLWIINDFATLEGSAAFHVGGTVAGPEITGRFSALEGGTIRFRQVRYTVDRGNIDLVEVDRFNPYLDIAAETKVSDYQVNLKIDGPLDNFTYELTSAPPLTQPEIVALLVSGRTPDTFLETQRVARDMASGYLTGGIASGLGGLMQGVTGLDQFSIDPVYLNSQGDPASRVTVGKQISENLFAAYSTVLGSTSEEVYQLEYRISRDLKFTSVRQADGHVGGDLRYLLRLSTAPASGAAPSIAPGPARIGEIRVEGDPGMSEKKLERYLRVEPGGKLDRARVAARVEKLVRKYHRKERLQATVETKEEPVEGDPQQVNLVLGVNAGPEVRIRVEGVPSKGKRRKEIEELWAGSIFPEEIPEEAREKLERSLREEGYYHAKAQVRMEQDTPSLREAVLTAEPGPRVKVEKVEIAGNQGVAASSLTPLLKTKPGRHGYLKPETANEDAGRIRAHYLSLGYYRVKVSPPSIDISPDGTLATVRFQVVEGDPVRIGKIGFEGNQAISSEKLLEALPVHPGAPFTRERARSGAEAIRLAYDKEGYSRAKVAYEIRGEEGPELLYQVEEGPRRLVGSIEIEGNRLTRREVVERELTFKEGQPLSAQKVLESQKALYRLGIFSSVEIKEVEGEDPAHPKILVEVAETRNLTQSLGIGYATDTGIRGLYDVTNSNLLGRGRTIGLQLRGSQVSNRIQFLLRDPYLFNRRLDSLLSVFRDYAERDSFTLTEIGTTLQVSNKHGEKNRTIYRYILKSDNVTDLQISPEEAGVETLRLSGFSLGEVHDSRDNFYNPRQGIFASADLSAYGKAIGSQAAFVKFFAQASLFKRLPGDAVWAQSMRLGLADPYGISDSVPLSERFFAGGDTTVRGYAYEELGPKDPVTGNPIGGESLFIINEEYRFPIWRFLRGVVFFDAGNVTSKLSEFDVRDLRRVLGAGFRIDTPIGPIRFEYGWKLDREEGETPGQLHITVGQAF